MQLSVEVEQEEDGRWLSEVLELPGVLAYGQTRQEAIVRAQVLALRVLADRMEHGENLAADGERPAASLFRGRLSGDSGDT